MIIGSIIMAAVISKIIGRQIIFLSTVQRRYRTNSRAERKALTGVISGKVTIYKAKSDELNMYSVSNPSRPYSMAQSSFSIKSTAIPLLTTIL